MGYYSEKAIELEARRNRVVDFSYPTKTAGLERRLDELRERLAELDEIRPRDRMDPLYDRYFYQDYLTHYYEDPQTVQGLLYAIGEVEELLRQEEGRLRKEQEVIASVCKTGADPRGQLVFINYFFPAIETIMPA